MTTAWSRAADLLEQEPPEDDLDRQIRKPAGRLDGRDWGARLVTFLLELLASLSEVEAARQVAAWLPKPAGPGTGPARRRPGSQRPSWRPIGSARGTPIPCSLPARADPSSSATGSRSRRALLGRYPDRGDRDLDRSPGGCGRNGRVPHLLSPHGGGPGQPPKASAGRAARALLLRSGATSLETRPRIAASPVGARGGAARSEVEHFARRGP